jgi:hypothetical protein
MSIRVLAAYNCLSLTNFEENEDNLISTNNFSLDKTLNARFYYFIASSNKEG